MKEARPGDPILLDFVLRSVTSLLEHRARLAPDDIATHLERITGELDLWRRRLQDLAGAAMSRGDVQSFEAAATCAGFEDMNYAELHQAGDTLVGWLLTAVKA